MPTIQVNQAFKYSPDGNSVVEIQPGEHQVTERCAVVAVEHLKVAQYLGAHETDPEPEPEPEPEPHAEVKENAKSGKGKAASKG